MESNPTLRDMRLKALQDAIEQAPLATELYEAFQRFEAEEDAAAAVLVEEPVSWVKSPVDGAVLKAEVVSIEGAASAAEDIEALARWDPQAAPSTEPRIAHTRSW